MFRDYEATAQRWELNAPFRISRGVKTHTDVVVATVRRRGSVGRGEGVPLARYGETPEASLSQLEAVREAVENGLSRRELQTRLPPGAARNALDCALWDLEARERGVSVASLAGLRPAASLVTALTVSLGSPESMGAAAARLADLPLIKIKVDAADPAAQMRAVRAAAPEAALIVDANEGWDLALMRAMLPILAETRIALLEQPLPAGHDEQLRGFTAPAPLCADESCHVAADLDRLDGCYQAVNIKLDKTGGLTGALELMAAARARGLTVMVGCMICTSLSIAPALLVAAGADFVDLDGPTWLREDRRDGVQVRNGRLEPPPPAFWGGGESAAPSWRAAP